MSSRQRGSPIPQKAAHQEVRPCRRSFLPSGSTIRPRRQPTFYVSIFANSRIVNVTHYGSARPRPEGTVMTVDFQLQGQDVNALNGGPHYNFTEALSLLVSCRSQEEVDELWDKLGDGGEPGPCGWLKDRYGLSWQIVPVALGEMLSDPDSAKSQRVMEAMLQMGKIDVARLRQASEA
ncbi:MAG TPA: VOC family protein [Candidatus Limnocylindrales bacterium]|nr:VOC family protein [Candidatus Limnocylindrales bacterium]